MELFILFHNVSATSTFTLPKGKSVGFVGEDEALPAKIYPKECMLVTNLKN
jgi:hypothetical protein